MDDEKDKPLDETTLDKQLAEFDQKVTPAYLLKLHKVKLAKKINAGETGLFEEFRKLKELEDLVAKLSPGAALPASSPQPASPDSAAGEAGVSSDETAPGEDPDPDRRALLKKFAVPSRAYHMSEAALAQRRAATKSPNKAEAMKGNSNAWKTGEYARSTIRQFIRPCLSTCPQFPCELIEDGETAPGSECLDKKNVVKGIMAIVKAMEKKDMTDFREIVAVQIAHGMEVLRLLADDIMTNGVKSISKKIDKDGNVIGHELKPNPALLPYPKLLEVLNVRPDDFMITDKAIEKQKGDEALVETITDKMSRIGAAYMRAKKNTVSAEEPDA